MEKYSRQWNVKEQRNQHRYDQHRSEAFEDIGSHREKHKCDQSCTELSISNRWPASVSCMIDSSSYALTVSKLFTKSFVHQDIGIDSHTDR